MIHESCPSSSCPLFDTIMGPKLLLYGELSHSVIATTKKRVDERKKNPGDNKTESKSAIQLKKSSPLSPFSSPDLNFKTLCDRHISSLFLNLTKLELSIFVARRFSIESFPSLLPTHDIIAALEGSS